MAFRRPSQAWIVAGSARVARAIWASLIGTRSSNPIRRSAGTIVGGDPRPSSHAEREGRAEVADDEPPRIGIAPLPCLGDPDRGGRADAQDLAGDLTPSLGRYALPIRALEHGEELAVRVAEAGSDLDLHAPRIRLGGGPTGLTRWARDGREPYPSSHDVRTSTQVTGRNRGLLRTRCRRNPWKDGVSALARGPNLKTT